MATIKEIIDGLDQLRKELDEVRQSSQRDEVLREAKLNTWTKRAYLELIGWGFKSEAEYDFTANPTTSFYETIEDRVKRRDGSLKALRDDLFAHPEHYESKLASAGQSKSAFSKPISAKQAKVFLGHGRNRLWGIVHMYLKDELHLDVEAWETESRAGQHSIEVLNKALDSSAVAVIVVTGEDATADGGVRARQNVVHEIGLFQGRLGFEKVALLQQDGIEEFSNLAGLQVIQFSGERIESSFYDLGRMLKREGLTK